MNELSAFAIQGEREIQRIGSISKYHNVAMEMWTV